MANDPCPLAGREVIVVELLKTRKINEFGSLALR